MESSEVIRISVLCILASRHCPPVEKKGINVTILANYCTEQRSSSTIAFHVEVFPMIQEELDSSGCPQVAATWIDMEPDSLM